MENWEMTTEQKPSSFNSNADKTNNPDEFVLSGNDFSILSNIVIYNAIKLYRREFNSKRIPATFIKFYFYDLECKGIQTRITDRFN